MLHNLKKRLKKLMIVLSMIVLNLLITCRADFTFSTPKKSGYKVYFMMGHYINWG